MKALKITLMTVMAFGALMGLLIAILVLLAPSFDGPLSRIAGGPFSQPSESGTLEPSVVADLANLELEVQLDIRPSVTVAVLVHDEAIFIPATLTPAEKRWPQAILDNPNVRVRVGGKVYAFIAYMVTDEELHQSLSALGAKKYSQSYFIPENTWFFQLAKN